MLQLLKQQAAHTAAASAVTAKRASLVAQGVSPDSQRGVSAQLSAAQGERLQLWYAVTGLSAAELQKQAQALHVATGSPGGAQALATLQDAVFEGLLQQAIDQGHSRDSSNYSAPAASPVATSPAPVAASPVQGRDRDTAGAGGGAGTPGQATASSSTNASPSPRTRAKPPTTPTAAAAAGGGGGVQRAGDAPTAKGRRVPPCLRPGTLFHLTYAHPSRIKPRASAFTKVFIDAADAAGVQYVVLPAAACARCCACAHLSWLVVLAITQT